HACPAEAAAMPKRVWLFLIALALVLGFGIGAPLLDRATQESTDTGSSISVAPGGFKALYLLLQTLAPNPAAQKPAAQKPVQFWQHSLMNMRDDGPKTVWLINPGPDVFFDGKAFGDHMRSLVDHGANLIVVSNVDGEIDATPPSEQLGSLKRWFDIPL